MSDAISSESSKRDMEASPPCTRCSRPMDLTDRYCRTCGQARGGSSPLMQNPWVILGLLFLVIGPLALPLLWRSPSFSSSQKIAIAVANLVYTAGLLWGTAALFQNYMEWILSLSNDQ